MDTLDNGNTENKDLDTTERREKERRDNEQRTESGRRSAWKARNGMGLKEELLQIIEGKSKEATREEGDTVIAVGGS